MKKLFFALVPFEPQTFIKLIYGMTLWWAICWCIAAFIGFWYWVAVGPQNALDESSTAWKVLDFTLVPVYGIAWFGGWWIQLRSYTKALIKRLRGGKFHGFIRKSPKDS